MAQINREKKIQTEGSIKKFNERFSSKISEWKKMHDNAISTMKTLDSNNVMIEVDFPSNLGESFDSALKTSVDLYHKFNKKKDVLFVMPKVKNFDHMSFLTKNNIKNFIVIECDKEDYNSNNEQYINKVSQLATGLIDKKTYGQICEVSNPENMYKNLLNHIENGVITLNYSAPVLAYNVDISEQIMVDLLPKITNGASSNWFNSNYPDMVHFWKENYSKSIEYMKNAHNSIKDGEKRKVLIECAAQHPLVGGLYPGEEFAARLDKALEIYLERVANGEDAKIYIPGSQHLIYTQEDGKKVLHDDKVSLSLSGAMYLRSRGVPASNIYSEQVNRKITKNEGVYNTGDETYVASEIFKQGKFNDLISVCSPGQLYRATNFYATHGVLPTMYTAPIENSYHNPVNELTGAIPNQLTLAPTWRKGSGFKLDEEIFKNSRNPFDRRNDLEGKIERSTKYGLSDGSDSMEM